MILDIYQKECVAHHNGPVIIKAGPGSGKTRVMSKRIIDMVENGNIPPEKIVAISFTKASAIELKERTALTPELKRVNYATFHSFFYSILKRSGKYKGVMTDDDFNPFIYEYIRVNDSIQRASDSNIKKILNNISLKRNFERFSNEKYEPEKIDINISFDEIYNYYLSVKKDKDVYDFDDLVLETLDLLENDLKQRFRWQNEYTHYMIDEFQDVNRAQYETIKILCAKHKNIAAVGDIDQSIYGFRGADPSFFFNFSKDFENTSEFYLKANYRSARQIVDFSQKVIEKNKKRFLTDVDIKSTNSGETNLAIYENPIDEANKISNKINELLKNNEDPREICIIYRIKSIAPLIASSLDELGIKYFVKDGMQNPFNSRFFIDLEAYILATFDLDSQSLAKIGNSPNRYLKMSENLKKYHGPSFLVELAKENNISYQRENVRVLKLDLFQLKKKTDMKLFFDYLMDKVGYKHHIKEKIGEERTDELIDLMKSFMIDDEHPKDFLVRTQKIKQNFDKKKKEKKEETPENSITLTTIHGSKGLEFKHVFVVACEPMIIPYFKAKEEDELEEERRMFYVAITRAKEFLYMSSGNRPASKGKVSGFITIN